MKTAAELQRDVLAELSYEPSVHEGGIGVAAHDGAVTLSGHVESYAEKRAAERAAKRVAGVLAVANELMVKLPLSTTRDDTDIAEALIRNFGWNTQIPTGITASVDKGWVILEGQADWKFQRHEAEKVAASMTGVKGVTNLIKLSPRVLPGDVERKIHEAFHRHAQKDADQIYASTSGTKVVLRGTVRSWAEYDDAEWAAWSAPGVTHVENHLVMKLYEPVGV